MYERVNFKYMKEENSICKINLDEIHDTFRMLYFVIINRMKR